ncbi:hypothetical protein ASE21_11615 [Flavobacterium sp. Root901]|uniref:hypothetical protein n=1 Tax=Flavobacterium sp. Root901 TaxID=1736605 RepID=UPI00070BCC2A|nr:hypothetical protein [Flavobacterium sp. Root901]KRD10351.1 hypothetical protein ASE21_11615 [Flavobacterium sp. Root901]
MKNLSIIILSVFFFSCQQKENKSLPVPMSDSITTKEIKTEEVKEVNKQTGDTIVMDVKNEIGLFIAKGIIDSIHPRVYVKFKNENPGELKGKIITPTGGGNIRFNQIIFPDKSSDGPFGADLTLNLRQKGNNILVIGHSQMADNPYYGKFEVQLENKK